MEELPPQELSDLRTRIITDEIQEYHDIKTLQSVINTMKQNSDEAVEQFKDVVLMLTDELGRVTGDHMLNMYKSDIINFINKNPKSIVDNLIMKCYEIKDGMLRKKIIMGEESFFLNNNLDDISNGESGVIDIIFKFKSFWTKLKPDNKEIIKSTLLAIIALCDIRYLNFKKYLCLKKLNNIATHSNYNSLFLEIDKIF